MATAVLALRMLLAAVFVTAGVGKLLDLAGSRQAVRDFGVPERLAGTAGVLLPVAELGTAAALVLEPSARWGGVAALGLLLVFIGGIGLALRRGLAPDCHCFGQIHSAPAGRGTLLRNGVLAAAAIFVIAEGPGADLANWVDARSAAELVAVCTGILAVLFGAMAAQFWFELRRLGLDLMTAQKLAASAPPGIPIGSPAPEFALRNLRGDTVTLRDLLAPERPVLLMFVSPGCGGCQELLPKIVRWRETLSERLTISLVSIGKEDDNQRLLGEAGLENVLLQKRYEVTEAYRVRATPTAVIVTAGGEIGSNPAESVFGIEPMLRLALRDGSGSLVEGSIA